MNQSGNLFLSFLSLWLNIIRFFIQHLFNVYLN